MSIKYEYDPLLKQINIHDDIIMSHSPKKNQKKGKRKSEHKSDFQIGKAERKEKSTKRASRHFRHPYTIQSL